MSSSLRTPRLVLGSLTLLLLALLPTPFLLAPGSSLRLTLGFLDVFVVLVLPVFLFFWLAPVALKTKDTLYLEEVENTTFLVGLTLRGPRRVDLSRLEKVNARTFSGRGGESRFLSLKSPTGRLVIHMNVHDRRRKATRDLLDTLCQAAQSSPHTTARARTALDLPVPLTRRVALALRSLTLFFSAVLLLTTLAVVFGINASADSTYQQLHPHTYTGYTD